MGSKLRDRWRGASSPGAEAYVAVETSGQLIKAIKVKKLGTTFVVQEFHIEDVLKPSDATAPEALEQNIAKILTRFSGEIKEVILVLNELTCLTQLMRVPVAGEKDVQNYLQRTVLKENKIDLSECFWSVLSLHSLSLRASSENEFSQKMDVLVCAAKRKAVDAICAGLKKRGFQVRAVLFQWPCLLKAFHLFSESVFEQQTIALLHMSHEKYSTALLSRGTLVECREQRHVAMSISPRFSLYEEVENYLSRCASRFGPVKCLFGSGDYLGIDVLISELRQRNRYSRSWSAIKKLPHELPEHKQELLLSDGPLLNTVLGAVLFYSQYTQLAEQANQSGTADRFHRALRALVRPLAASAALLGALLASGLAQGLSARAPVVSEDSSSRPVIDQTVLAHLDQRLTELHRFSQARTSWSTLLVELYRNQLPGMEMLQVRGNQLISSTDLGGISDSVSPGDARRSSGTVVLEARYPGLQALEAFIEKNKTNPVLRAHLSRRQPVRVANVTQADNSAGTNVNSVVALEFLLEEKTF